MVRHTVTKHSETIILIESYIKIVTNPGSSLKVGQNLISKLRPMSNSGLLKAVVEIQDFTFLNLFYYNLYAK